MQMGFHPSPCPSPRCGEGVLVCWSGLGHPEGTRAKPRPAPMLPPAPHWGAGGWGVRGQINPELELILCCTAGTSVSTLSLAPIAGAGIWQAYGSHTSNKDRSASCTSVQALAYLP